MNLFSLIDNVTELTDNYIGTMKKVPAVKLGLDNRCGSVFVSPDCIAVYKENSRMLEYYGGFEYVDNTHRYEMGGFVFYSYEDNRVQGHLDSYLNAEVE